MCLFNFQGLPPPAGPLNNYKFPREDADRAWELCVLANEKWQNEIGADKNNGSVVFGGCTIGARAIIDMCEYNISGSSYLCGTPAMNSSINWPQSVTILKIRPGMGNNDGLKAFMKNWRTVLHKPHLDFVILGATDPGNPLGSKTSVWGAGGMGISRKVVPCDALSPSLTYPTKKFPVDSLNAAKTRTVMDDAYREWQSLCNVFILTLYLPWPAPRPIECLNLYPAAAPAPGDPPAQRGPVELRQVRRQLGPLREAAEAVRLLCRAGEAGSGSGHGPQGLRPDLLQQMAVRRHGPAGKPPPHPPGHLPQASRREVHARGSPPESRQLATHNLTPPPPPRRAAIRCGTARWPSPRATAATGRSTCS